MLRADAEAMTAKAEAYLVHAEELKTEAEMIIARLEAEEWPEIAAKPKPRRRKSKEKAQAEPHHDRPYLVYARPA